MIYFLDQKFGWALFLHINCNDYQLQIYHNGYAPTKHQRNTSETRATASIWEERTVSVFGAQVLKSVEIIFFWWRAPGAHRSRFVSVQKDQAVYRRSVCKNQNWTMHNFIILLLIATWSELVKDCQRLWANIKKFFYDRWPIVTKNLWSCRCGQRSRPFVYRKSGPNTLPWPMHNL